VSPIIKPFGTGIQPLSLEAGMEALKMAVALVLVVLLMFLFVVSEAYKYRRPSPKLRRRFWKPVQNERRIFGSHKAS